MPRCSSRPLLALPALVLGLALLAACAPPADEAAAPGATEPTASEIAPSVTDPEALERVAAAAAATADAGSSRFELTVATAGTAGADGAQPVSVAGEEDFDAQQRRMTFQGPAGELEIIVDGTDVYVEIPATEDEQWARVELDDLIGEDVGFGGPGGLPFQSPQANLAVLGDAVIAAEEGDVEDVRGVSATRYDLTLDLERAAQDLEDAGGTFAALAGESGLTEMDLQVWIDDEDLISRIAYSLDLSQADVPATEVEGAEIDPDPSGTVTVSVDYFDHGLPVEITVPDESSIVDVDEDEIRGSMPQAPPSGTATEAGASPVPAP